MLSARAGEESRVEGMEAGADDYLVKPFSARELLARVAAHLQMARLRREAERVAAAERGAVPAVHEPQPGDRIHQGRGGALRLREPGGRAKVRPPPGRVGRQDGPRPLPARGGRGCSGRTTASVLASRTTAEFVETATQADGRHHYRSFKFPPPGPGGALAAGRHGHRHHRPQAGRGRTQRERDRLHVTLASIGDAVITTDTKGKVAFLNGVAESVTGWANADAVGRPLDAVFRIVNEATRQPVESPAIRALREGVVVGLANHTVLLTKDGAERPIDDSAAPVRDGEGHVVGCVLVFRDVAERRRLERQAREQAEAAGKLAAIVDSSEDAIISKTLGGIIQSWNAAAERIFGYTAEEAVGRPITMLFPADRLEEEERIIARIRSGERVEHFDTVRLRKDGTAIPISLTISPLKDGEGRIIGASKIARDITERKRAEAALRHSEGRLAAELEATTRLHDLSTRLLSAADLTTALDDVLENAI